MSDIKKQILTLLKQRHHSHKVALEQEKDPRSKHAIDLIARIREDSRLMELIGSLPEEKPSKDLEEEIQGMYQAIFGTDIINRREMVYLETFDMIARHFAEWQKKQDKDWLNCELMKAHLNGVKTGDMIARKEMMRDKEDRNDDKLPRLTKDYYYGG